MLDTVLTLLAAKAKTVALVAGTAAVTAGAVGGGTVALQAVSDSSDLPAAVAPVDVATPTSTIGIGRQGKGQGAQNRSDTATAVLTGGGSDAPAVTFTCDPANNHGQNVSAYARSLPKGPGRGAAVSEAARSDCGKGAAESPEVEEVEAAEADETEAEQPKAAKPAKPAKAAKPVKAGRPAGAGKPEGKGSKGKG